MAQQNYKKFVATAATATLVASAIVPVASANVNTSAFTDVAPQYKDAVEFLVSNNIAKGMTETQFGISQQIKRVDAAIMIAAAAGLNDETAPASGFSDVPKRAALAVNSLKAAGIVNGKSTTKFGAEDYIKRGEAALMLQRAFDLQAGTTKNNFSDVSDRYDTAVDALVANKVTKGINDTQFGTQNNIKRGDFAMFLFALKDKIDVAYKLDVESLKANSTTSFDVNLKEALPAEVDAAELLNVKVTLADGTVVMPKVTDLKVSTDRKTLTVEHKENDLQGLAGTLTVNSKSLAFDYSDAAEVKSVAITTTVVDEDTEGQQLSLSVNGSAMNLDTLVNAKGWDVEFQSTKDVFKGSTNNSKTGILDEKKLNINDTFEVKVVIKKEGKTIESELVTVKVISNVTPVVGDIELSTTQTGKLKSSTISLKDSAVKVGNVVSSTGQVINVSGEKVYKSSNPSVASIDSEGKINPISPGTTTITVQAGKQVFTKEIKVVDEARISTKATPLYDTLAMAKDGKTRTMSFKVTDQFGDTVKADHNKLIAKTSEGTNVNVAADVTSGKVTVDIPENAKVGNYSVYIHNVNEAKNIGQFKVTVSAANTIASYKIVPVDGETIDLANPENLEYTVDAFNKDGGYLQTLTKDDSTTLTDVDGKKYSVEVADKRFAQYLGLEGNKIVIGKGTDLNRTGSTDVVLKKDGIQVAKTTVKVVNEQVKVTGIDWKSEKTTITNKDVEITFEDALNITELADVNGQSIDPIVNGVKLSTATTSKVRVGKVEGQDLVLYLDKDDNGSFNTAADVELGKVTADLVENDGDVQLSQLAYVDSYNEALLTTELNNKGTVVFKFVDTVSKPSKVVSASTLYVNVK